MDEKQIMILMQRTTLRQVEVLVALRDHKSMTKAAAALGMTVANVSRTSQRFENNLGLRLFEGSGRRFRLKPSSKEVIDLLEPLHACIGSLRLHLKGLEAQHDQSVQAADDTVFGR